MPHNDRSRRSGQRPSCAQTSPPRKGKAWKARQQPRPARRTQSVRPVPSQNLSKTARFANRYKRLFSRLSWPSRILLIAVTSVITVVAALIALRVLMTMFFILLLIGLFAGRGGGEKQRSSRDNWRKEEQRQWDDMHDAEQRRHEDEGRV